MKIKKTVVISSELWDEIQGLSDNFSALVETALREYLRRRKIEDAKKAFGSWTRDRETLEIVEEIREDDSRRKTLGLD